MSVPLRIAKEEWRQWQRSRLAVLILGVFAVLLIVTSALTATDMLSERDHRLEHQAEAEETFLSQPDRHPHRMVHYGHYVFRTPAPLSVFDPGVDAVTGQSIFLEGHRQNSAMFADARGEARVGGFGSLTPAKLYHLFLPLLLIALGHALILRERESRTLGPLLSQGVTGAQIFTGKSLALLSLIGLLSIPALIVSGIGIIFGEPLLTALVLYLSHVLYLGVWGALILLVTAIAKSRGFALGILLLIWFTTALIIPRLGVTIASASVPMDGKIITDMKMNEDLRKEGDGHNAADPAFAQFRANLLAFYDVETIEDLPINYRGAVAQESETNLTDILNQYAERRMEGELSQSHRLALFNWISPYLAIGSASRHLAGTDLATHHRFLREAEALRFDFVSGLNKAHEEVLSYEDDINRNRDEASRDRARISAENWAVLDEFKFIPDPAQTRLSRSSQSLLALLIWLIGLLGLGFITARRLTP